MLRLLSILSLGMLANCCSDWIMDDEYGLSVRTMDLGTGPLFSLLTQPKGHKTGIEGVPPTKLAHLISVGANMSDFSPSAASDEMAFAGLNEAGLSCDLHALLNSSYPPRAPTAHNNLNLYYLCNWALGQYETVAAVKAALGSGEKHLWGEAALEQGGVHFMLRDATGAGLAIEFMDKATKLYDDLNDGVNGVGVFTNEPPFPWQLANVAHYRWKQSLARPSTTMPGAWYPDERFLRVYLTKSGMPKPKSYQQAVQYALHVLNTITVPPGLQMGTDSGFGEGANDHTHYGHIYDHKGKTLYWRHVSNLQLERVRLADVLERSPTPMWLSMVNDLPFFNDASDKFTTG